VQLVNPDGSIRERHGPVLGPVTLPPHITVPLVIRVVPEGPVQGTDQERADKMRVLEETDSATFVATLIGAEDKRKKLEEPWRVREAEAQLGGTTRPEGHDQGHSPRLHGAGRGDRSVERGREPLARRPRVRHPQAPTGVRPRRGRGGVDRGET